jgi:UDP-N-acetyl-D-mannosaminuronic acid dehydrogenase
LPIDPWFLGQGSDELDLISTAREVNDGMSQYIIEMLREELGSLAGTKIAILGVAYKGNVGDTRMSPGLKLARELQATASHDTDAIAADGGAAIEVALHDPHVDDQTLDLVDFDTAVDGADAVVITTDHDEFKEISPADLSDAMRQPVVFDTKDILDADKWKDTDATLCRI